MTPAKIRFDALPSIQKQPVKVFCKNAVLKTFAIFIGNDIHYADFSMPVSPEIGSGSCKVVACRETFNKDRNQNSHFGLDKLK